MKKRYGWYLAPEKAAVETAWEQGLLTVDANVLLDLYRYHKATQERLLDALRLFEGRTWLSHQAAEEFIGNRTTVISEAAKTFGKGTATLDGFQKALEGATGQLRGYRLVPRPAIDEFGKAVETALAEIESALDQARESYPDYLKDDPILDRIFDLFEDSIGDAPTPEESQGLIEEAQRRQEQEIPPGYLDSDKEGDRAYGDYLLWHQVLKKAKEVSLPVVLVTSERKEDWWEVRSGERIGPRSELLREASKSAGQLVLIYQTDHFLQLAAAKLGTELSDEAVEEIRKVSSEREARVGAHAVFTEQSIAAADRTHQEGQLTIHLVRPLYRFTGSGKLEPRMESAPLLWAELVQAPDDAPPLGLASGTGTVFDFHVHLKSKVYGEILPTGDYVINYRATCQPQPQPDSDAPVGSPDLPDPVGQDSSSPEDGGST